MRLETGLFSSKSGLDVNGQAIAIIGDNVANANTPSYKVSRVEFGTIIQDANNGRESDTVGAGVVISAIRTFQAPSDLEFTGRALDVGIAGRGFFIVGDTTSPFYTRDGTFSVDKEGVLVNKQGKPVLGYTGTATPASGGVLGSLNIANVSASGTPTSAANLFGNLNSTQTIADAAPANPATFSELGLQASSISNMTVYDSLGATHEITIAFTKLAANSWSVQAYINGSDVGGTDGVPSLLGSATLTFDSGGLIPEANQAAALITAAPAYSSGAAAGNFTIDFSGYTQFAAATQVTALTQDGVGVGAVTGYEFRRDGKLFATTTSGQVLQIGTIPLATFVNEEGLQRNNGLLYQETSNSGARTLNVPTEGAAGEIQGASLERSAVDLASEFTNMIVYQRGYQASSQALNATNDLLRDTIGLIR